MELNITTKQSSDNIRYPGAVIDQQDIGNNVVKKSVV